MKNLITGLVLVLLSTSISYAQSMNRVYIDQIGNNSVIDITQTGSGNILGNNNNNLRFNGNSQNITILQIGANNTGAFNIQGSGTTVVSSATGNLNTITIACGAGQAPNNACVDSTLTANASGDNNVIGITAGSKTNSNTNLTGNNNLVTITSSTANMLGSRSTITANGNSNEITVDQNGVAGLEGFYTNIDVTGSSNLIGVTQSGTVDSNVFIKSIGSNNNIIVRSGS